jgi:hypothetical protein
MSSLLLTCNKAYTDPLVLSGVGFHHPTRFVIYAEADHDAVAFAVRAVNLDTGEELETGPGTPAFLDGYSRLLWQVKLPPGRWQLNLETLARGYVAERVVEVHDAEAQD